MAGFLAAWMMLGVLLPNKGYALPSNTEETASSPTETTVPPTEKPVSPTEETVFPSEEAAEEASQFRFCRMDSDLILVMENGHVACVGNHERLMKESDFYRGIYESQQKGSED